MIFNKIQIHEGGENMKGYYTSIYTMSYAMNIKELKGKVLSIIEDININTNKRRDELNLEDTVEDRDIVYYLYTGITLYNELFLLVDKPKGIKGVTYDRYRDENNRIFCKSIILKLGTIRTVLKKKNSNKL